MTVDMNTLVNTAEKSRREARIVPGRARNQADVSRLNTVPAGIQSRCMDATMELIRWLYPISDLRRYQNVVRYLLVVVNWPLKRNTAADSVQFRVLVCALRRVYAQRQAAESGDVIIGVKIKERHMNKINAKECMKVESRAETS